MTDELKVWAFVITMASPMIFMIGGCVYLTETKKIPPIRNTCGNFIHAAGKTERLCFTHDDWVKRCYKLVEEK